MVEIDAAAARIDSAQPLASPAFGSVSPEARREDARAFSWFEPTIELTRRPEERETQADSGNHGFKEQTR